ncbi:hypothetical protein BDR26DRAFT_932059 [Obelidium mucronatum]|nr:hypothetical protein BDR26DRAFT_932059 [Obelidium mucronatum]
MKAVAPKSTSGSSLWITTSTKSTQRIGLLPSPVNTTKICTLQHSHYTLHTLFTSTRVHSDRLIYALAGSLFDSRSPQPFGGTKMNPGFLKYQGTTAAEVLQFIITESYTAYWNEMNVKGIKFVVTSVNRTMDLHYRGMKDEIDELMLKGMKKAGAIEWFGAMLIPKHLCHAYEDEAVSNGIDFTFPSKALNTYGASVTEQNREVYVSLVKHQPCCSSHSLLECYTAAEVEASQATAAQINKGFATANARPSYAPHSRIEPSHINLTLNVTEAALKAKTVKAQVAITLSVPASSISSSAVNRELVLNAVSLNIEKVVGADSWNYDGKLLSLRWVSNYSGGIVVIDYTIEKPIAGLYFHVADSLVPDRALHVITDHETERARYWLPCVDYPLVRTTLGCTHHTAVANGAHISTTVSPTDPSISTSVYKLLNHTCPSYLICWAVGDYLSVDDENLLNTFGKTGAMIRWMQKKVGLKFPWEKYFQIISPKIEGGAMENISLVTYKDIFLVDERLGKDGWQKSVDGVNVHEMAHTYFGDLLTIRHFEHAWLKESWATYMDYCWSEDHYSHEEARYDTFLNMENYVSETSRLYYVNTYNGRFVETEDFKRALESESGLNLTKFFDQWIYGRGFPKVKAEYSYDADKKIVQITLEQTQADKDLEIPASVHSTEAVFNDASGAKVIAFVLMGDAKPDIVEVDPRGKVLHTMDFNPDSLLTGQLIKNGSITSMKKVSAAVHEEPFWGVRQQVYNALSESKLQSAVDILANALAIEKDPKALRMLVNAGFRPKMRAFRHPDDAAVLIQAAADPENNDLHGFTLAGIITGLGLHRSRQAFDALVGMVFSHGSGGARQIPESCTVLAVEAIASSLPWQDNAILRRETAEKLADLVRTDPAHRVQKAGIYALAKLEEEGKAHFRRLLRCRENMRATGGQQNRRVEENCGRAWRVRLKKMETLVQLLEAKEKSGLFVEAGTADKE